MKRLAAAAVLAAAAGFAMLGTGGVAGAADNASVSVVHGIPNTPVNVFVNGDLTLRNFKPGTVAGPLSAGAYEVKIFPAANTAGTGKPVITGNAQVPAGANVSLVAHLTAAGQPTLTPFVNDVSKLSAGQARLLAAAVAGLRPDRGRPTGRPVPRGSPRGPRTTGGSSREAPLGAGRGGAHRGRGSGCARDARGRPAVAGAGADSSPRRARPRVSVRWPVGRAASRAARPSRRGRPVRSCASAPSGCPP